MPDLTAAPPGSMHVVIAIGTVGSGLRVPNLCRRPPMHDGEEFLCHGEVFVITCLSLS